MVEKKLLFSETRPSIVFAGPQCVAISFVGQIAPAAFQPVWDLDAETTQLDPEPCAG
jgi:hypothetical protein